jgi:hypothetical protein
MAGSLRASKLEPPEANDYAYTDQSLNVRVTECGAETSYEDLDGLRVEDFTVAYASEDLSMTLVVYPLPALNDTATIMLAVTNRDPSSHSYFGVLTIPESWVLLNPPSNQWSRILAGYQTANEVFTVRSGGAESWTILVELRETGNATHRIVYGGYTGPDGASTFAGGQYARAPCIPTILGGCGDFNQLPCQGPVFHIRGSLYACGNSIWGQNGMECNENLMYGPSKQTLMRVVILPDPYVAPPCAQTSYEYVTNTDLDGNYDFTVPYFTGWYFVNAHPTDARSLTGTEYDVWVATAQSCVEGTSCVSAHYVRTIQSLYLTSLPAADIDLGKYSVPEATSAEASSVDAPGGAFRIQTLVATESAPFIDCINTWPHDHWDREQGVYRTRYRYPDGIGGNRYMGKYFYGGDITIHGPGFRDWSVHHEYGHHTMGVHYTPGCQYCPDPSQLMEGWAEFYWHAVMNESGLEGENAGWSGTCPWEDLVENSDPEARNAGGVFWDMYDGANECFDKVSGQINTVYDRMFHLAPNYMCDFVGRWDVAPLEETRWIWMYHGYNRFEGSPLPECQ